MMNRCSCISQEGRSDGADVATGSEVLRIETLGRIRLWSGAKRLHVRLPAQALLVLARVVASPDASVDREELAFTLWPEDTETEARAKLRRQLYNIQRAAADASGSSWLSSEAQCVTWTAESWVDVAEFDRLSAVPDSYEAAAELYRGPFAPSLDHDWVRAERARFERDAVRLHVDLAQRSLQCGDLPKALHYVEQLLRIDPWREDALRHFMMLRLRLNDRAGALCRYREFRLRLWQEFEVEPMPETIRYYDAVVAGSVLELAV